MLLIKFVKKNCILNDRNNPPQEGLNKPVSVNHQVNIEVEERVEGEEVSDRGVVGVETSDKVVLEDAEAKLGVDDTSCQQDYHSHEADDELQPGLDKLHCSQLSKGLEWYCCLVLKVFLCGKPWLSGRICR